MGVTINRKQLVVELAVSEPILKAAADAVLRQQFFLPAVEALKESFDAHPVTEEIEGGPYGPNLTNTLQGFGDPPKAKDGRTIKDYVPPNLVSFIGLEDTATPLEEIRKRLDPSSPDGPKMVYQGMDRDRLAFRFTVKAPDLEAIYAKTPFQGWLSGGISWVKRIEQGIPGVGFFLNAKRDSPEPSRSGGGIQIDHQLRSGRFKPISYLSGLFNAFLRKASSGRDPS